MEEIGVMMKNILKEVMEEVVRKEHEVRIEIGEIKKKREQKMVEWRKEREKLTKRIERLKTRQSKKKEEGSGKGESTKIEFRMKELKWGEEMRDREGRRRDIYGERIKGASGRNGRETERLIGKKLGMEKEVEELKIIGRETKVRRIKLRNLQIKEEVLSNRRKFTKERLSVEEDLT